MGSYVDDIGATAAFAALFGLHDPWRMESVRFDADRRRLIVSVGFERGGRFRCAACGFGGAVAYDSTPSAWNLRGDLAGWVMEIRAKVPRVRCSSCGRVRRVETPWKNIAGRIWGVGKND